jgi:hypothetical protein
MTSRFINVSVTEIIFHTQNGQYSFIYLYTCVYNYKGEQAYVYIYIFSYGCICIRTHVHGLAHHPCSTLIEHQGNHSKEDIESR